MKRAKQQANQCFQNKKKHKMRPTKTITCYIAYSICLWLLVLFNFSKVSAQNDIVTENQLQGNPSSEWDINGAGDLTIQGFATDISVNKGERVQFKIKTNASAYTIDIYRLGYYQGNGARKVGTGSITATLPQNQPTEIRDNATGLVDCGNWAVSAHWDVPTDAVSGIYLARLKRNDNGGASHIVFIVRDDASNSDLYFQTSDATWQAYNVYGGATLYVGNTSYPSGHAVKVSYNRPFLTRDGGGGGGAAEDWVFNAEYPMVRWLERNGYDVTYTTNIDADRRGHLIKNHKVFLSVGHDEYWSAQHRVNVEAARDAGVHLAFFSGNEVYWKTRWETSIDGSGTPYRTLVCYKEGNSGENICGGKCDPLANVWTGLWRGGCDFPQADGCKPENALTGQISWIEATSQITVPGQYRNHRFWRNTSIVNLTNNQAATFVNGILGYELDYEQDNGAYPSGRVTLSETPVGGQTHKLSLYRHNSSGALVFGAGSVQWSWGLDGVHDRGGSTPDARVQQATVNLLADMGVQPATLQSGLTTATGIIERVPPASVITTPANGSNLANGVPITIQGTASENEGVVAGVEISVDGGATWKLANGTTSWNFTWTPQNSGAVTIKSRSFDDMGNMEQPGSQAASNVVMVNIGGTGTVTCPCTIFQSTDATAKQIGNDGSAIEVGVKFRTTENGYITGIRFYKGSGTSGAHIGHLWSTTGTKLAEATFINETASGWQQVNFASPVAVTAGTTYIASYHGSAGAYVYTDNYFTQAVVSGPLRALANGEDGSNGVYIYSPVPAFPTAFYQSSNYWVDVVFNTSIEPDLTPPAVVSTSPASNATGVSISSSISALFSEAILASTVSSSTVELRQGNTIINATVNYDAGIQQTVLTPSASLAYSTTYTVTIRGGSTDPRVKDLAGNALSSNYTWSFTTGAEPAPPPPPPPPPTEGAGGPILLISSAANPFSRYPVEILRAEGWNAFMAKDISQVVANELSAYDVIILGEMSLSAAQVTMFTDWVTAGGTLVAMRPDNKLAALMGITIQSGTLSDKYLKVSTASEQGKGIVAETIQFHGPASLYNLDGATALAILYSSASTATPNPAVTVNNVGNNGGQAIAFAYDLARSVVYSRQGNPVWAGQKRDGQAGPKRSDDMYYGNASFDPQIDWVDLNKVAIPQADEQQRLLTNIIIKGNEDKKPLPRFWFLPRGLKAAIVMTGDDHGNGGTAGRFNQYKSLSPSNTTGAVADWKAIRGSSYIYSSTPITNTQVNSYQSDGFEIGLHLNTDCDNWTPTTLQSSLNAQLSELTASYPSVLAPNTNRTHCIAWSDWVTKAKVQSAKGIRLDVNYYYWPGSWIQNRPGMFTGSGMPMRFADLDGSIIDCYQVPTQMTDESDQVYPGFIDDLLDRAIGQEGYYGVFCANMHTDNSVSTGSDAIINSALARNIPVVSAKQMLTWLDSRNASTYSSLAWENNVLSFSITTASGARNLEAMLPFYVGTLRLKSVAMNSATQAFRKEAIKGTQYAFFPASTGNYTAIYELDPCITPPTATLNAAPVECGSQNISLKLATATGQAPYKVIINGVTYSGVSVGQTFATIPVSAEQNIFGNSVNPDNANYNDGQAIEVGVKFRASQNGTIIGIRFYKGSANTGTHTGSLWTSTGTRLASATFINETASGWQEVRFASPVAITANTTYIASYLSSGGGYAASGNYFTINVTSGALTALQSGVDGPNGLYKYGGGFPDQSFNNGNYWVDVLFKPDNAIYTFTLSKITDANDCENSGSISSATLTQEDLQAGKQTYYQDQDNDGFGNTDVTQEACTPPAGYVAQGGDCNDGDAAIKPGAAEICDNKDNDCDGQIDEGVAKTTYYRDLDDDGYGSSASTTTACSAPDGYVAQGGDCNDSDATINPGAAEVCGNGKDDNCDGQTDEGLLTTYYRDADGDGFGLNSDSRASCSAPLGYVTKNGDCNDSDHAVYPDAAEACDGKDNDCDGQVDEECEVKTYYLDNDQDGFGDISKPTTSTSATPPAGYVANSTDCNDSDAAIKPGATEVCDGKDNDCDGQTDEGVTQITYYRDADADGYGTNNDTRAGCAPPAGYVAQGGDCNDSDAAIKPGATEVCDGKDNDCDGATDEGCAERTYYLDNDQDGFGDISKPTTSTSATPPAGYVANSTDCNDSDAAIKPGATEVCDGKDNDCDGQTDEGVMTTFYRDADGDGYGTNSDAKTGCTAPAGYIALGGDCNDNDVFVYPGLKEFCDSKDNNCNGKVDERCRGNVYYRDADGDQYGDPAATYTGTTPPVGYILQGGDCNDSNAGINPSVAEKCNNGIDDNCNGQVDESCITTYYKDGDSDSYGDPAVSTTGTTPPAGYVSNNMDCNDAVAAVKPGATEVCGNNIDDNCNGITDEGCTTSSDTYYKDEDGDGYGNPVLAATGTTPPAGYVANNSDCNDSDAAIKPGATEVCDGKDNDCDGQVDENVSTTYYRDLDGDGYGNPGVTAIACALPAGYVSNNSDCNDSDAAIKPGATEVCDGKDNDCDGQVDEGCNVTSPTMSISDVDAYESDRVATLTVRLSQANTQSVTVNYTCVNGTAVKPGDYKFAKGTLTIPAGTLTGDISVAITRDAVPEQAETFTVELSSPVNATIADGTATVTILDGTAPVTMTKTMITSDNELSVAKFKAEVFPNPSTNLFNLRTQSSRDEAVTLKVWDVLGRVVELRKGISANGSTYFGRQYRVGVYYAELIQGRERKIVKLLKLKD